MELYHTQLELLGDAIYEFSGRVFYKRNPGEGKLMLLCGLNGCGKTHAAKALHSWFNLVRMGIGPVAFKNQEGTIDAQIPNSICVNWPEVVAGFKQDQWLIVDLLCNEYFAVIDDIGGEYDPSGVGAEKLYLILSRREHKHTVITTNVSPEKFCDRFERRIASRLFRNTTEVDLFDVPDFSLR